MSFQTILKAIYKAYNVDFCYVADNIGIDDEIVQSWENGESIPDEKQLEKFSELFAVPLKTLKESIKQ